MGELTSDDIAMLSARGKWEYLGRAGVRAARLCRLGLLASEPTGRRLGGVFYSVTPAGRAILTQKGE